MLSAAEQNDRVDRAFSRQSSHYDQDEENHVILAWMRRQIRAHIAPHATAGARVLELNCGTGLDAVWLAQRGCTVHATDVAAGMIEQVEAKVARLDLAERITVQRCSYTELAEIDAPPFDFVFSNFGGLNCAEDLRPIADALPHTMKPGAHLTWVIMPPVCPWEIALALRGHLRVATRRLRRRVMAHLEGVEFATYYYTPADVLRALGPRFERVRLQGLGALSPPPYMTGFPRRFPRLYRRLAHLDARVGDTPPFNRWADHFALTARFRG